jgi:hypothetical protein
MSNPRSWLDSFEDDAPTAATKVAWGGELRFAGAREDDKQGRTVKFDILKHPEEAERINPFASHTRRRAGHGGTRFHMSLAGVGFDHESLQEVMLLGWSDGPKGQTVTFLLGSDLPKHPFMHTERNTTYMGAFVEIDDDDAVVDQVKRERVEKAPQKLSNVAAQMLKNPTYLQYLMANAPEDINADEAMKTCLDIESKRELDSDADAVKRFRVHCDRFVAWQKENGYLR